MKTTCTGGKRTNPSADGRRMSLTAANSMAEQILEAGGANLGSSWTLPGFWGQQSSLWDNKAKRCLLRLISLAKKGDESFWVRSQVKEEAERKGWKRLFMIWRAELKIKGKDENLWMRGHTFSIFTNVCECRPLEVLFGGLFWEGQAEMF